MPPTQGQLIVRRPARSRRDRLRGYSIFFDGQRIGKLRPGGQIEVSVAPGEHRLHAQIDGFKSRKVELAFRPGDQVTLVVEPGGGPWQFYQLALPGRYLKISHAGPAQPQVGA